MAGSYYFLWWNKNKDRIKKSGITKTEKHIFIIGTIILLLCLSVILFGGQ